MSQTTLRRIVVSVGVIVVLAAGGCASRSPQEPTPQQRPTARPLVLGAGDALGTQLFARQHGRAAAAAINEQRMANLPTGD